MRFYELWWKIINESQTSWDKYGELKNQIIGIIKKLDHKTRIKFILSYLQDAIHLLTTNPEGLSYINNIISIIQKYPNLNRDQLISIGQKIYNISGDNTNTIAHALRSAIFAVSEMINYLEFGSTDAKTKQHYQNMINDYINKYIANSVVDIARAICVSQASGEEKRNLIMQKKIQEYINIARSFAMLKFKNDPYAIEVEDTPERPFEKYDIEID